MQEIREVLGLPNPLRLLYAWRDCNPLAAARSLDTPVRTPIPNVQLAVPSPAVKGVPPAQPSGFESMQSCTFTPAPTATAAAAKDHGSRQGFTQLPAAAVTNADVARPQLHAAAAARGR